MIVTPKKIKEHREMLLKKLKDFVPQTYGDRFSKVFWGLGFVALFPLMSMFYPSAGFLACLVLGLTVFVQFVAVCLVSVAVQYMQQMPTDIRKMQSTMLDDPNLRIANILMTPILLYLLFISGYPVFMVLIGFGSIGLFVLNAKFREICKTEA